MLLIHNEPTYKGPATTNPINISLGSWIVPFIVADFALLPMFHIGGVPWKPGYLLLIAATLLYVPIIPRSTLRQINPIINISVALLISLLIGTIIFHAQTAVVISTDTLRPLIIYTLIPIAFFVGFYDRRTTHNYIVLIIVIYLILNIIHSLFASNFDLFANFYGTKYLSPGELYGRGIRVPGIMNNPNLSALTSTLLLMWFTLGLKYKFSRSSTTLVTMALFAALMVVMIMVSRNQVIAIIIVITTALFYLPRAVLQRILMWFVLVGVIVSFVIVSVGDNQQERWFGLRLTEAIERRLFTKDIGDGGFGDKILSNEGLLRPVAYISFAQDRFLRSPLLGTGYETTIDTAAPNYHNDWVIVFITGGVLGLIAYLALFIYLVRLEPLLGLPLLLPGLTNSILGAPQHLLLLMLLAGVIAGRRFAKRKSSLQSSSEISGERGRHSTGKNRWATESAFHSSGPK